MSTLALTTLSAPLQGSRTVEVLVPRSAWNADTSPLCGTRDAERPSNRIPRRAWNEGHLSSPLRIENVTALPSQEAYRYGFWAGSQPAVGNRCLYPIALSGQKSHGKYGSLRTDRQANLWKKHWRGISGRCLRKRNPVRCRERHLTGLLAIDVITSITR